MIVALPVIVLVGFFLAILALILRRFGWRPIRPGEPPAPPTLGAPPVSPASSAGGPPTIIGGTTEA